MERSFISIWYLLNSVFLALSIDGHSINDIVYRWLTNKTETSVYKNKLVIPQFYIEKIEIASSVGHYTVGRYKSSILPLL